MKNLKLALLIAVSLVLMKCEYQVTDFGFNSSIQGVVKDKTGTPVYGDLSSNNLVVKLLGEGDAQAMEIRVKGDGTFQNTKIFPKVHDVWIEGPIEQVSPVQIDFSSETQKSFDFTVTPLISPKIINGSVTGSNITVNYEISPNNGNSVKKMEIYCSTVKFPTAATGSRTNIYFTKKVSLTQLSGSVAIDGLETGTKFYIRIGAQAGSAAVMNYSNQIEIDL